MGLTAFLTIFVFSMLIALSFHRIINYFLLFNLLVILGLYIGTDLLNNKKLDKIAFQISGDTNSSFYKNLEEFKKSFYKIKDENDKIFKEIK